MKAGEFGSALARPFDIGGVRIPNRVVLAPMAGLTTGPYRRQMKEHGVGLVFTEMVSAQGLLYKNRKTEEYLDFSEDERPLAIQLFAGSADALARAAGLVLERERVPDLLDINMGCPVRKVVKTDAGSAMMGDFERAVRAAATVVAVASRAGVPVMVKLRSGLRPGDGLAVRLAPRLEEVGVAALSVHPRAASQYYAGKADHSVTAGVVGAVDIPVVASGDVRSLESAGEVMAVSGAAALMVARGAAADPWLVDRLLSGESQVPSLAEVVADLRSLLRLASQERGEERAARWIRKLLTWRLRPLGVPAAAIERMRVLPTASEVDVALAGVTWT